MDIEKIKASRNITKEDLLYILYQDDVHKAFEELIITPPPAVAYDEQGRRREVSRLETIFQDYTFDGKHIDDFLKSDIEFSCKIVDAICKK